MNKGVVVFGSSLIDINFFIPRTYLERQTDKDFLKLPYGAKIASKDYSFTTGGSGLNFAFGLKKLGGDVNFRTNLSDDVFSNYIRDELKKEEIEVIASEYSGSTPLSVVLRSSGDRTIITGADHTKEDLDTDIPGDYWVHIGPMPDKNDRFLEKVNSARLKSNSGLSMNPSMAQIEERSRVFMATLKTMDLIFLNLLEALRLVRLSSRADIKDVCRAVHALGPETVCITNGEKGAYVSNRSKIWYARVVCDEVCREDATGAGDAFGSGFLAFFLDDNESISEDDIHQKCLKAAMLNSGSVVAKVGAKGGLLDRAKIEEDLGTVKIEVVK